ncbi:hypothetical protein Agub_g10176, partial [Astrephomene gubernaculifera]
MLPTSPVRGQPAQHSGTSGAEVALGTISTSPATAPARASPAFQAWPPREQATSDALDPFQSPGVIGSDEALPHGWRELPSWSTSGPDMAPPGGNPYLVVIPAPSVLSMADSTEVNHVSGGASSSSASEEKVTLELLYGFNGNGYGAFQQASTSGSASDGDSAADKAQGGMVAEVAAPRLRVVMAAGEHVLVDEVYDTSRERLPYISLPLAPTAVANLPTGPLHVWLLSTAATDPDPSAPSDLAPSVLVGDATMLLLPPPAAKELSLHVATVLSKAGADATATSPQPPLTSSDSSTRDPWDGRGAAARSQVWTQHLQPLLYDFGYVLTSARDVYEAYDSGMEAAAAAAAAPGISVSGTTRYPGGTVNAAYGDATLAAAWADVALDVLAHCEAAGLPACAEVIRGAVANVARVMEAAVAVGAQSSGGGGNSGDVNEHLAEAGLVA